VKRAHPADACMRRVHEACGMLHKIAVASLQSPSSAIRLTAYRTKPSPSRPELKDRPPREEFDWRRIDHGRFIS
jgi:hypothetical protein